LVHQSFEVRNISNDTLVVRENIEIKIVEIRSLGSTSKDKYFSEQNKININVGKYLHDNGQ